MRRRWTDCELDLLRSMYAECHTADVAAWLDRSMRAVFMAAEVQGLRKSPEYLRSDSAARIRRGKHHPACIASRIKPGATPWNKGLKGVNGNSNTRFRPGQMPQTWRPVGSIRIERDGPKVKVSDTRSKNDWLYVHHIVWEEANGPAPAGFVIAFKTGMRTNVPEQITADRLECIDRAELARRNHPRNSDPELGRLIQLKGAITRQVNRIAREAQEHRA